MVAQISPRIIVLPTGTGKTLVEIMLLDHFLGGDDPEGFAVVVVNVAPLVSQHADCIEKMSSIPELRVTQLLGHGVEWTPEYWQTVRRNNVIVCTAEILRKALIDHAFLRLDGCKLLVFDEAHHALGGHPFVKILEKVSGLPSKPRLVGLTACFLHGRFNKPEVKRKQLEERFAGTIWVPAEADIQEFLPTFNFERLVANQSSAALVSGNAFLQEAKVLLQSLLSDLPEDLQEMVTRHADKAGSVLSLLGRAGAEFYFSHGVLPYIQQQLEVKMKTFSKGQKSQKPKLQSKIAQLEDVRLACQGDLLKKLRGVPAGLDDISAKTQTLIQRLRKLLEDDPSMRCIVFVEEVAPTYPLAELLNSRVKHGVLPISGRNSMTDGLRDNNLAKLRSGEDVWCLVATNSIEEGIDIPACNVVVRFDAFHNVKSHVQGSGRCREAGKGGLVIYFENEPEEEQLLAEKVHRVAQRAAEEPVAAQHQSDAGSSIDPATGAEINRSNCLSMLNHYISHASSGKQSLNDAFKPDSASIQECVVPAPDMCLTVSLQEVKMHKEIASWTTRERFAFVTLTRLRERGLLSENHLPQNCSYLAEQLGTAHEATHRKRHLHFNPEALEHLQAVKTELAKRLTKGLSDSNSKSILKECIDLLLRKPCGKDDIAYLEVSGSCKSVFQCQVFIKALSERCFSAGESCAKKTQAEQSAASVALAELRSLLDPQGPVEPTGGQEAAVFSKQVPEDESTSQVHVPEFFLRPVIMENQIEKKKEHAIGIAIGVSNL